MEAAKEFVRHSRTGSTATRVRVLKELLSAVEEKSERLWDGHQSRKDAQQPGQY